jgi:hypothetical protein
MSKIIVDAECGAKECGKCRLLPQFFCAAYGRIYGKPRHPERAPACLAADEQLRKLLEACRGLLTMMDRGPQPHKLDEALAWRENDVLARSNAIAALAPFEDSQ